ncbi:hypothetical protein C8N43_2682 [Litoreibacter ponti]|uniref:Uncharacterized protein n=1 Tax=Litoreibacter ponti TaxID=1510457 RepID=A0A2T6BPM3_9RHOB|nr:hypothetical protein [Litoreibacter ponti]PTX58006.1 hypothetical protein C8N43_2682 [Litoreibacter ponti]
MYLEDSFFTLNPPQQVGLIAVSVNLMLISFWVLRRLSRIYSVWVRLPMALALFYLFVWVTPQAYYQYYRLIFLDLPQQLVIKGAPPLSRIVELMTFRAESNLSAHSQGLLGWALVLFAIFWRKPVRRDE